MCEQGSIDCDTVNSNISIANAHFPVIEIEQNATKSERDWTAASASENTGFWCLGSDVIVFSLIRHCKSPIGMGWGFGWHLEVCGAIEKKEKERRNTWKS